MGKRWKIGIFCLCVATLLSGCGKAENPPAMANRIQIWAQCDGQILQRTYTAPNKMETILYYLRFLEPVGYADTDPERTLGASYRITVYMTGGQRHIYLQRSDRYLSRDFGPWRCVDGGRASVLYPLLKSMPSDETMPVFSSYMREIKP